MISTLKDILGTANDTTYLQLSWFQRNHTVHNPRKIKANESEREAWSAPLLNKLIGTVGAIPDGISLGDLDGTGVVSMFEGTKAGILKGTPLGLEEERNDGAPLGSSDARLVGLTEVLGHGDDKAIGISAGLYTSVPSPHGGIDGTLVGAIELMSLGLFCDENSGQAVSSRGQVMLVGMAPAPSHTSCIWKSYSQVNHSPRTLIKRVFPSSTHADLKHRP